MAEADEPKKKDDDVAMGSSDEDEDYNPGESEVDTHVLLAHDSLANRPVRFSRLASHTIGPQDADPDAPSDREDGGAAAGVPADDVAPEGGPALSITSESPRLCVFRKALLH